MKLVANLKLLPTPEQAHTLRTTLACCNVACEWISTRAFATGTFQQFRLHRLVYKEVRARFGLSAQVAVRCIAKVADAYKAGRGGQYHFRPYAAQPYDDRIFRFRNDGHLSLWTLAGRLTLPFVCGDRQRALLAFRKGEVDLMLVGETWYLACVCDVPDPEQISIPDVLGVDPGIINLAVDSDGTVYSGAKVDATRRCYAHRRRNLQRKQTKTAKRKLQQLAGKQQRFQRDVNHCISKAIVETAQRSGRAIALEDLTGIRNLVQASRRQRSRLHNWAFGQLRQSLTYKARLAGVPVLAVDPRYTSRTCPACGCVDVKNRPSQSVFSCIACKHAGLADHIAARIIRPRAAVNLPMVGAV